MFHFVNSTSLPGPGEASSEESFSDMCRFAPLSWKNILGMSCSNANETGSYPGSRFGTMFAPLTEPPGEETSISSAEVSPARMSARQEKARELPGGAQRTLARICQDHS
jgi:hypothetical protein